MRPIAVFDSGVGGLTSLKVLEQLLPGEDLVYFGDTSRVPYGTRSKETIIQYALQDVRFLRTFDPKAVLIACGTVSSVALDTLRQTFPLLPMFGVVESAVEAALKKSKNKRILVLGTPATIASGSYANLLSAAGATVATAACPLFVPLVENGHIMRDDPIAPKVVEYYLKPMKAFGADTVILGCTHYPLLRDLIADYMGEGVTLIDVGRESALACKAAVQTEEGNKGRVRFFVSDTVQSFEKTARIFLGRDMKEEVEQIDIQSY